MPGTRFNEREIIQLLTSRFSSNRSPLGFEDDVAALPISRDRWAILKTDMLVGSTDIPPGMSLSQAARKSVVATVSDFAAKGVLPKALLVSLGLKRKVSRTIVRQIASGLDQASREYGCTIVGGDTNRANDLVIDLIGIGFASPRHVIRRRGAKPGDIVVVTGEFGKTAAGLHVLLSRRWNPAKFRSLTRSVLHPVARLELGVALANSGAATGSIDSSDGLAWSLYELARASRVNIRIEKIPIARDAIEYAKLRQLDPNELALYGGEEYEIIATISPKKYVPLTRKIPSLIRIGKVERGTGLVSAFVGNDLHWIEPRGWDHFS
jgi:thiamine-monophosphate kinase